MANPNPFSYKPEFYRPENIIGYSGDLNDSPTVYFKDSDTGEFGHITQRHEDWNVGREEVGEASAGYNYVIENGLDQDGNNVTMEKFVHPMLGATLPFNISHARFVDGRRLHMRELALLALAIWQFPEKKPRPRRWGGRHGTLSYRLFALPDPA